MRSRRASARPAPTIKYVFREDAILTFPGAKAANPQMIGEALAEIAARDSGRLTPAAVVAEARNLEHPLHSHFEWDDRIAAQQYRLDQARTLIRLIRVEDVERDFDPPAFLSVSFGSGGRSYRQLGEVLRSRDLQDAVLQAAERDLRAFERRYERLVDVCRIVRDARRSIEDRRSGRSSEERPSA